MDGILFLAVIAILFIVLGLAATAFGVDSRPDFDSNTASPDGPARAPAARIIRPVKGS